MSHKEITKQKSVRKSKTAVKVVAPAVGSAPQQLSQALAAIEVAVADLKEMSHQSGSSEHRHNNSPKTAGAPANDPPSPPEPPVDQVLTTLENAISDLGEMIPELQTNLQINVNLTGLERQRLFGVKSRKYGFITNAWNIARDNPDFAPPQFSMNGMAKTMCVLENVRQLTLLQEQYLKLSDDYLLMTCNTAYRDALRIYGSLREQSRNRVAGATALFQELRQFFTLRRKRPGEEEPTQPTEHELERDYKRLIHGKADGEMTVKHVSPHVVGGLHEVVDDVHRQR
ncbi:MAG: hypothetical protein FWD31_06855 [Planctomycetaceae bacterium]|nr:hypothetical protein [Planctomycetaceae bacterium]